MQLDENHSEIIKQKNEELDQWLMKIDRVNPPNKKIPGDMVRDIKDFFKTYWEKDHTMIITDENFLYQLPRDIKTEVLKFKSALV